MMLNLNSFIFTTWVSYRFKLYLPPDTGACFAQPASGLPNNFFLFRHTMACIGTDVYLFGGFDCNTKKTNVLCKVNLGTNFCFFFSLLS